MTDKNKCYECEYRGKVPGDCHSKCTHPEAMSLKVKGDEVGIRNGWFMWPYNFDPVWLIECNGFKKVN